MAACRMLQLILGLTATPGFHALHLQSKQREQYAHSLGACSLKHDMISEMSLFDGHTRDCTVQTTAGVDFVSFVRKHPSATAAPKKALQLSKNGYSLVQRSNWGDGQGDGLLGDDCLRACDDHPGYCAWCGDGNACCLKGDEDGPAECQNITSFVSDGTHHECVEPLNPAEADVKARRKEVEERSQLVVWVSGYPRSGSSTLLSMVSATVDDNRAGGHTFSLFEPCHDGDKYEDWMEKRGCRQLLYGLSHCEFEGIRSLWGWMDPHSSNNYSKGFNESSATKMCQDADIVAFKTVDWGHDLAKWKWLMDSHPNMKVLDVVRDPRAIYASWKKLEPFKSLVQAHDFYTLEEICNHFAKNLDFQDPRVYRVVFEDLMKSPEGTTRDVYAFLKQQFSSDQEHWFRQAFNAEECPPPAPGMEGFTDCHTFTGNDPRGDEKWRYILTVEELAIFEDSHTCQRVAKAYRYPKK